MATRLTLNHTKIRRESFASWCPSCGRKVQRDGRLGAFNRVNHCNSACYDKFRKFNVARVLSATGNRNASIFNFGPIPPGAS